MYCSNELSTLYNQKDRKASQSLSLLDYIRYYARLFKLLPAQNNLGFPVRLGVYIHRTVAHFLPFFLFLNHSVERVSAVFEQ